MASTLRRAAAPLLLALLAVAGCGDEVEHISGSDYMLSLLHRYWNEARQTLQTDQPDLSIFSVIDINLKGRVLRSVEKSYSGDNKAEAAALESITAAFYAEITPKLTARDRSLALADGVTIEQLRAAFDKIDQDYRKFQAMTGVEPAAAGG